jgi:hypothetical protein
MVLAVAAYLRRMHLDPELCFESRSWRVPSD